MIHFAFSLILLAGMAAFSYLWLHDHYWGAIFVLILIGSISMTNKKNGTE